MMKNTAVWNCTSDQANTTNMAKFMAYVSEATGSTVGSYKELHKWSLENSPLFWELLWDFAKIVGDKGNDVYHEANHMIDVEFFPDGKLNFAENLLRRRDAVTALVFAGENRVYSRMSFASLYDEVSLLQQALLQDGVKPGDRVCAFLPNIPEAIIGMLATASIGAIWSSCSPDFGVSGVVDRFGQIEPKVLIASDGYFYGGKKIDNLAKVASIAEQLPSLERVLVIPYLREGLKKVPSLGDIGKACLLSDYTDPFMPQNISFERFPFNHPLYILFSSGTTGTPKCIVHGAGGTLLQHVKEHQLHNDINENDRVFYFTTCAWMMWNWLVSCLASKASLVLYDGSPFYPESDNLFALAQNEKITHFGTSAKFIETLKNLEVDIRSEFDLSNVRVMNSTGSPLSGDSFDYVYEHINPDLYLASIAGGTDIISCFVLGNLTDPLHRGEIACAGLGMAVQVWNEQGHEVAGEKGELVCVQAFPSMPLYFWNDKENKKYISAYFERFEGIWAQGDFAERTPSSGFIIHGRSDATLNPGGVRIGTAEIYRQVEQMMQVSESVVIGQEWKNDVRVVLFVVLNKGVRLDEELEMLIRNKIREGASPRHVPAVIVAVDDIPRTKSGKISELAVKNIVHDKGVDNTDSLSNPDCLSFFSGVEKLSR